MSIARCCECNKKAAVSVDGHLYCGACSPLGKPTIPEEVCVCTVDEECKEEPKKKGFWSKVAGWFNDCSCNCGL